MAKKETKSEHTLNGAQHKSKAKKRKHVSKENEEEVASKSLIVESTECAAVGEAPAKTLKRKNKEKDVIKQKRSKHTNDGQDDATVDEPVEEEMQEPTLEELCESEKPENVIAVVTVRQKKKKRHEQRLQATKEQTISKERYRNEEYLRKWKNARAEWKFEKLRQISIQRTVFEEEKISAEMWPIALEYLSSSKGAAKAQVIKLAEECIDELDKQCAQPNSSEEERKAVIDSSRYQRARDLLQSFD
ncbi:uncharacterized protein C7orf50 homolog isoform X1 [Anastrepha obliqua]|uniref:uncharacterized protein C7orf50 homolog isoform X1 n=1 Tax=Anastrepha obliqua TaxID=95512 RepID=UPI002409C0B4|nr:uncharacterized protein C7orf50 homolog isoform X1 [Anastrepha obliqua]